MGSYMPQNLCQSYRSQVYFDFVFTGIMSNLIF